jgi:hypothetical protein
VPEDARIGGHQLTDQFRQPIGRTPQRPAPAQYQSKTIQRSLVRKAFHGKILRELDQDTG